MDAYIRKLQNNLVTIGTGVVVLSIWTLLKTFLYGVVFWQELSNGIPAAYLPPTIAIIIIIVLLEYILHCYIGLSARSEGSDQKKSIAYLVVTGIIILFYIAMVATELVSLFFMDSGWMTNIVTTVIDCTSLAFMADMMISSIRLRKLKKQLPTEKEAAA